MISEEKRWREMNKTAIEKMILKYIS